MRGVKARKVFRCGVSEGITGFSARDAAGRWAGIEADFCASRGKRVSFARFARYGVPFAACQLAVAALYVLAMFWLKA